VHVTCSVSPVSLLFVAVAVIVLGVNRTVPREAREAPVRSSAGFEELCHRRLECGSALLWVAFVGGALFTFPKGNQFLTLMRTHDFPAANTRCSDLQYAFYRQCTRVDLEPSSKKLSWNSLLSPSFTVQNAAKVCVK
jgi:hypothetical protein